MYPYLYFSCSFVASSITGCRSTVYQKEASKALSAEEKEIVRKCMKTKYTGHIVGDPNIDELLEELERDHGIQLKRLPVTSVVAV